MTELGIFQLLAPSGEVAPPWPEDAVRQQASDTLVLAMYRSMLRSRVIDEKLGARQRQGRIGFHGGATGQEAVPTALSWASGPEDWVFPALRESTIMLDRGFPLTTWLAQSYGSKSDPLQGRQMPCHMSSKSVHQVSWSSNMATQLVHAVGAAKAAQLQGDDMVSIAFLGDGATSEPDFQSALLSAKRLKAPVLFVCQNNQWAISLPVHKQTRATTLAQKAQSYGLPAERVDGNDVVAVYATAKACLERMRQSKTPEFLECLTYRMGPHSSSDDPSKYRSREEETTWAQRDPILRLGRYLKRQHIAEQGVLEAMREELQDEVLSALRLVEEQAKPAADTLFSDVYATKPDPLLRQQKQAALHRRR